MTGLFDAIEAKAKARQDALDNALRSMKGQKLTVLRFFVANRRWVNQSEAMDHFTERNGGYFVGPNYGRRMRELLEAGLLASEPDPNKDDRTHRWSLATLDLQEKGK